MPGLLIKQLPDDLHRRLKERAAVSRRSMSSEVLVILEEALDVRAGPPSLEQVDALRQRGQGVLTDELIERGRREGRS